MRATCPIRLILFDLIILSEEYKLQSSYLLTELRRLPSCYLDIGCILRELCCNSGSLCIPLGVHWRFGGLLGLIFDLEHRGSQLLQNVGELVPDYTASHPTIHCLNSQENSFCYWNLEACQKARFRPYILVTCRFHNPVSYCHAFEWL
jgi:hypothetical protein